MWKRPKYLQNFHETVFIMFFIILREVALENVSPSVRWNLRGFSLPIDCRWQVSCSRIWELGTPNPNAIISKTKTFSQLFERKNMYLRYYRLEKFLLENWFKGTVSEQALAVNMWKPQNCLQNLHESAFIIFFYHSQACWFGICLP